ncbi:hypothetical protein J6590_017194 [Homalodisca vitripennis]|nr:hypothetical protein J6590_017194 [Homalodisca vitripennis]
MKGIRGLEADSSGPPSRRVPTEVTVSAFRSRLVVDSVVAGRRPPTLIRMHLTSTKTRGLGREEPGSIDL